MNGQLGVHALRFAYGRGAQELFDGFTHDFEPGAVTALTGPSGRGKSTLLYVLGLLLTPTSGTVTLDGVAVSGASDAVRAGLRAKRVAQTRAGVWRAGAAASTVSRLAERACGDLGG